MSDFLLPGKATRVEKNEGGTQLRTRPENQRPLGAIVQEYCYYSAPADPPVVKA